MGVQQNTVREERRAFGVLETLSPELARDLGDAFSLARIGSGPAKGKRGSVAPVLGALRLAGRMAVFLFVAATAVSLTAAAMYLMSLR